MNSAFFATLAASFTLFAFAMVAIGLGLITGRRPLTGSCGGNEKGCGLCGPDRRSCEERRER